MSRLDHVPTSRRALRVACSKFPRRAFALARGWSPFARRFGRAKSCSGTQLVQAVRCALLPRARDTTPRLNHAPRAKDGSTWNARTVFEPCVWRDREPMIHRSLNNQARHPTPEYLWRSLVQDDPQCHRAPWKAKQFGPTVARLLDATPRHQPRSIATSARPNQLWPIAPTLPRKSISCGLLRWDDHATTSPKRNASATGFAATMFPPLVKF